MKFKIGFTSDALQNTEADISNIQTNLEITAKKSLVSVYFPQRQATYSYFNDAFDLHEGDMVFVEGKLEGLRGTVTKVSYNFKIKLSDYKRVIAKCDTSVKGQFYIARSHMITTDSNTLPYKKVIGWFKPPKTDELECVCCDSDEHFNIFDLNGFEIEPQIAKRGYEYYHDDCVMYIEIANGRGRAIVDGTKPYEVEFNYNNGEISGLVCDCFCNGSCKHEFAVMLQLKDLLETLQSKHPEFDPENYFAAINKTAFIFFASDNAESLVTFE